ncbi:hypothetical protein ACH5RR_034058 [Cinchona calisaya]|uniref:Transposase MuDR plant domain-containing protein n=1 Tax=Cinchona calisaya TaxID=153742 RepID=A0ABD2YCS8_9GENT
MSFRKPKIYALEAPKYDDIELNSGAGEIDVNVGASEIDVNGRTNERGVNSGTTEGSKEIEGGVNGGELVRVEAINEENIEDSDGILNGGTTEGGEAVKGGVNRGKTGEADVHGESFMSDANVEIHGAIEANSGEKVKDGNGTLNGHYTSEDGGSCEEKEFEAYSNFCRDEYMNYGKPPPESHVLDEKQGVAQEVASDQGAGAEFQCAGIVGSSGDEFQCACVVGSVSAKQARAQTEYEHVETDFVDPLLGDSKGWELCSHFGSFDDKEKLRYTNFRGDRYMRNPTFELGIKFANKKEFKAAIDNYSIVNGKNIYVYTRDRDRVIGKCKSPCKWFVYVLEVKALRTHDLIVKSMNHQHTNCNHCWKNKKGLASAIAELLPNLSYIFYLQHMYMNFKKRHPGKTLQNMLWSIASSSNVEMYELKMRELKDYDVEAFAWVKKALPPENWCSAFFSHHTKCDTVVKNMNNGDPHYYADPCYKRDMFMQIYGNVLHLTNGKDLWTLSDEVDLDLPIPSVQASHNSKTCKIVIEENVVRERQEGKTQDNNTAEQGKKGRRTVADGEGAKEAVISGRAVEKVAVGGGVLGKLLQVLQVVGNQLQVLGSS